MEAVGLEAERLVVGVAKDWVVGEVGVQGLAEEALAVYMVAVGKVGAAEAGWEEVRCAEEVRWAKEGVAAA